MTLQPPPPPSNRPSASPIRRAQQPFASPFSRASVGRSSHSPHSGRHPSLFVPSETNPFSSLRDFCVEALYEIEGSNFALYRALKANDIGNRLRDEISSNIHAAVFKQLGVCGFPVPCKDDLWTTIRPGIVESISIGATRTPVGSLAPVVTGAAWPIRVLAVVRCNENDAGRASEALCWLHRGSADVFSTLLRLLQDRFPALCNPRSQVVRMIPPDSAETPVDPEHFVTAAPDSMRSLSPVVVVETYELTDNDDRPAGRHIYHMRGDHGRYVSYEELTPRSNCPSSPQPKAYPITR